VHSNKSITWVRKFNSDIKQITCHNKKSCGGTILLQINTYFKKTFRGGEWKLPSPSTIPLRSTGDVKKDMTAKNRRRTLFYIPVSSPSGRIPLMRIPLGPFQLHDCVRISIKRGSVYQTKVIPKNQISQSAVPTNWCNIFTYKYEYSRLLITICKLKEVPNSQWFIHSFGSLSYDRSKASSKASSPHTAIQSFFLQMRVSSPFLKVIQ
jgi:hypothetical protein